MRWGESSASPGVIDWQREPLDSHGESYDFFFDTVGKSSFREARPLLRRDGTYVSSELGRFGINVWLSALDPLQRLIAGKRVMFPVPSQHSEVLAEIRQRLEAGEFRPLIDRVWDLDDVARAFEYVETGQKTGNVLVRVASCPEQDSDR